MKERAILFNAPMVRALLDGSKTQTRRAFKVQPSEGFLPLAVEWFAPTAVDRHGDEIPGPEIFGVYSEDEGYKFLYGAPGDQLFVRETFFAYGRWETLFSAEKGRDEWHFVDMTLECGKTYSYAETDRKPLQMRGKRDADVTPGWWKRPAIFMPRAASRITLEITGVRVERLQDISKADATAEGVDWFFSGAVEYPGKATNAIDAYRDLLESINGPGSWAANPWVWVIDFKRI